MVTILSLTPKNALALPDDYQSLRASVKQELLWDEVKSTPYETLPTGGVLFWPTVLFETAYLRKSFDHAADELPVGRKKIFHPFGSVALVRWIPLADSQALHPFTGVFAKGGIGVARLSLAADERFIGSYTPGMALKILINKKPSVNIQVMNSLDGQKKDRYFFSLPFSNIIPEPQSWIFKVFLPPFSKVQKDPLSLPLNHFSEIESNGKTVDAPRAPERIFFVPNPELPLLAPGINADDLDFRENLNTIPPKTNLYAIYAVFERGGTPKQIGTLQTQSEFIASSYGDEKLFFQHPISKP